MKLLVIIIATIFAFSCAQNSEQRIPPVESSLTGGNEHISNIKCLDSVECEGECIASGDLRFGAKASGRCVDDSSALEGCFSILENGKVKSVKCQCT